MFEQTRQGFTRWLRSGLEFSLPWHCLLCQTPDPGGPAPRELRAFCQPCRQLLAPAIKNRCVRCAAEVGPHVTTSNGCVHCRSKPLRFESVVCLSMYDDGPRRAILSGKWSPSAIMIEALARLLASERREELRTCRPDIVIPVPQSAVSRITRNFNSATLIATVLAEALDIPVDHHILRRSRHSRPQKRVAVNQRFANQQGAFAVCDAHVLKGKRILLVDDVLTTGATCSEAARLLKRSSISACHVAVIARVLDASA